MFGFGQITEEIITLRWSVSRVQAFQVMNLSYSLSIWYHSCASPSRWYATNETFSSSEEILNSKNMHCRQIQRVGSSFLLKRGKSSFASFGTSVPLEPIDPWTNMPLIRPESWFTLMRAFDLVAIWITHHLIAKNISWIGQTCVISLKVRSQLKLLISLGVAGKVAT